MQVQQRASESIGPGEAIHKDGRGTIEIDPQPAANVKRIFHLYAYENLTLDCLVKKINGEGMDFRVSMPKFPRR